MTSKIAAAAPIIARLARIADALATLARQVRKLPTTLAHRDQLQRLAEYEDHLLADIGFTREDMNAALAAPFWHDPSEQLVRRLSGLKADRGCRTVGETAPESGRSVGLLSRHRS